MKLRPPRPSPGKHQTVCGLKKKEGFGKLLLFAPRMSISAIFIEKGNGFCRPRVGTGLQIGLGSRQNQRRLSFDGQDRLSLALLHGVVLGHTKPPPVLWTSSVSALVSGLQCLRSLCRGVRWVGRFMTKCG